MVKATMRKSLFFKVIGIVVGTLLLSLLFVGWAIGGDLMRFFSGELSRTIRERLDAVVPFMSILRVVCTTTAVL